MTTTTAASSYLDPTKEQKTYSFDCENIHPGMDHSESLNRRIRRGTRFDEVSSTTNENGKQTVRLVKSVAVEGKGAVEILKKIAVKGIAWAEDKIESMNIKHE